MQKNGETRLTAALSNGSALEYFCKWIRAQGGDSKTIDNPSLLPHAKYSTALYAPEAGYIAHTDTQKSGTLLCCWVRAEAKKKI